MARRVLKGGGAVRRVVDARFLGEAFVTLFVIMMSGRSSRARRRAAWQAVAVSFAVICSFAVFGQQLLDYLGIGIPALQGPVACCSCWSRSSRRPVGRLARAADSACHGSKRDGLS
jgi:hypothetical protein